MDTPLDPPPEPPAGRLPGDWKKLLGDQPAFRTKQIFGDLHRRRIRRWEEMTSLPLALRESLVQAGSPWSTGLAEIRPSPDGTEKAVIQLQDNARIETVVLTDRSGRRTACLSSQAGCARGCRFCRTGQMGLVRSLTAAEMVEQVWHTEDRYGPLDNLVYMGMGEPFDNLKAWEQSVRILCHPEGRGMSARRITVSTCGLPEGIRRLGDSGLGVRLAVSLTSADPARRTELMPVNRKYPLDSLRRALLDYQSGGGKRVTLEMVQIRDFNDTREEADRLAAFCRGLKVLINVIPWNPVPGLPYREPDPARTEAFLRELEKRGLKATRRKRRGSGADGACGQLGS